MDTNGNAILQWLHGIGIHLKGPAEQAAQVAQSAAHGATDVATQVGSAVGGVIGPHLDMPALMALAAALGWASGIRLYAVVFLTGLAGAAGWIPLPAGLHLLQHPAMLAASGAMLFVEFFADKIPGLDSLWDIVHSVIRIPAGAALAAGALGADSVTMSAIAALMGGTLAATSQAAKTTTRAAINTSPEPFSNIGMSLVEDVSSAGALWLATAHPLIFGGVLVVVVIVMWLVTWSLYKFLRAALKRLSNLFNPEPKPA